MIEFDVNENLPGFENSVPTLLLYNGLIITNLKFSGKYLQKLSTF